MTFVPPRKTLLSIALSMARSAAVPLVIGACAPPATAQQQTVAAAAPAQLAPVTVQGNYDNAVGTSDAASQGSVSAKLIASAAHACGLRRCWSLCQA